MQAVNTVNSRIVTAYMVEFLVTIGPFDHVIVTSLHVLHGIFLDARVAIWDVARCLLIVTAGTWSVGLVSLP